MENTHDKHIQDKIMLFRGTSMPDNDINLCKQVTLTCCFPYKMDGKKYEMIM